MNDTQIFITTVIILCWILIIGLKFGNHLDKKIEGPKEKSCPPHNWGYEEQLGMPGTYYTRCQICRRLPGWEK